MKIRKGKKRNKKLKKRDIYRVMLAKKCYDIAYKQFESFAPDHIGEDLAYLMGALLKHVGRVDMEGNYRSRPLMTAIMANKRMKKALVDGEAFIDY